MGTFLINDLDEDVQNIAIENFKELFPYLLFDDVDVDMFKDACLQEFSNAGISLNNIDIHLSRYTGVFTVGFTVGFTGVVSIDDIISIVDDFYLPIVDLFEITCTIRLTDNTNMKLSFDTNDWDYYNEHDEFSVNKVFLDLGYNEDEINTFTVDTKLDMLLDMVSLIRLRVSNYFINKAEKFQKELNKLYSYHLSDEYTYDFLFENEIKFYEDGSIVEV